MKLIPSIILFISPAVAFSQLTPGEFYIGRSMIRTSLVLEPDSTFHYKSEHHPFFYYERGINESGRWAIKGDTVVLNPQLDARPAIETEMIEGYDAIFTTVRLRFNLVRRTINKEGVVIATDTSKLSTADYSFNTHSKRRRVRVSEIPPVRCTYAGYIPRKWNQQVDGWILIDRPADSLQYLFFDYFESRNGKQFPIRNARSNCFTINVYHNTYEDGQLRQQKLLVANNHKLYAEQREDGRFIRWTIRWMDGDGRFYRKKS